MANEKDSTTMLYEMLPNTPQFLAKSDSRYRESLEKTLEYLRTRYSVRLFYDEFTYPKKYSNALYYKLFNESGNNVMQVYHIYRKKAEYISIETEPEYLLSLSGVGFENESEYLSSLSRKLPGFMFVDRIRINRIGGLKMRYKDIDYGTVKDSLKIICDTIDEYFSDITHEGRRSRNRVSTGLTNYSAADEHENAAPLFEERFMAEDIQRKEESETAIKIDTEIEKLDLHGEDREAVVKVRVNQGVFRESLLKRYSQCCLCGISDPSLLTASHIKPWSESEPSEKLDVDNGFLFCPNHDKLFDKGFISFTDEGKIMISSQLRDRDRTFTNINPEIRIDLTPENREYLAFHRENVFKH